MKQSSRRMLRTGVLLLGFTLTLPVSAQMGGGMMGGGQQMGQGMSGTERGGPGMQQMSGVLHDMADQTVSLSGQMSQGNLSATQQKQMAERIRTMAGMMDRMSGMTAKGMTMDAEQQKQFEEMRTQMEQMRKSSSAPMGK